MWEEDEEKDKNHQLRFFIVEEKYDFLVHE